MKHTCQAIRRSRARHLHDAPANATMCRWQHMRQSKSAEPPPLWNILRLDVDGACVRFTERSDLTRSHFIVTILLGSRRGKLERLTPKYIGDCVLDVAILDACSAAAEYALEGFHFSRKGTNTHTHTHTHTHCQDCSQTVSETLCQSRGAFQELRGSSVDSVPTEGVH